MATDTLNKYAYMATDANGELRYGKVRADSLDAVANYVSDKGLRLLDAVEASGGWNGDGFSFRNNGVGLKDLSLFFNQMSVMQEAGLSVVNTLSTLHDSTTSPGLREAIAGTKRTIELGEGGLSAGMAKYPNVFPPIAVAIPRAGENGGYLADGLKDLTENFEKELKLRGKIKTAMTYPVIVLIIAVLLIVGMVKFIIPNFVGIFAELGGELPLPTRILMGFADSSTYWLPLFIGAGVAVFLYHRKNRHDPKYRERMDRYKLKMPIFGPLITKIAIARFARNFSTLLNSGVTTLEALIIARDTAGNEAIAACIKDVEMSMRRGTTDMVGAMKLHDEFPPMLVVMIGTGTKTAELPKMLRIVSEYFDREVEVEAEQITSTIQPMLMVVVGFIILLAVIGIYMPISSIYTFIG